MYAGSTFSHWGYKKDFATASKTTLVFSMQVLLQDQELVWTDNFDAVGNFVCRLIHTKFAEV